MSVSVIAEALGDVQRYFEQLPEIAMQAATMAINSTAERKALPDIRAEMREQLSFPSGYLEGSDGSGKKRLSVSRKASKGNPSAAISGRDRATSLARFRMPGQDAKNTRNLGVRVRVKPGYTRTLKKAFLITLRNGNMGLAVRLKPGDKLANSSAAKLLSNNVYLLYGPSVDQVFRSVATDVTPEVLSDVTSEFLRQFARLSRG